MCVVSMVADHYGDKYRQRLVPNPGYPQWLQDPNPLQQQGLIFPPPVSREEFEALRKDVSEMVILLKRAQEYDKKNNEPECETDEKMALIRAVAKAVGVDLDQALSA